MFGGKQAYKDIWGHRTARRPVSLDRTEWHSAVRPWCGVAGGTEFVDPSTEFNYV